MQGVKKSFEGRWSFVDMFVKDMYVYIFIFIHRKFIVLDIQFIKI